MFWRAGVQPSPASKQRALLPSIIAGTRYNAPAESQIGLSSGHTACDCLIRSLRVGQRSGM